jgi:hypothetical protein
MVGTTAGGSERIAHKFGVRGHVRALKAVWQLTDRRTPKISGQEINQENRNSGKIRC